ncbi:MAG: DUF1080 domain-containing protein [Pirellulales bacterium]
MNYYLRASLGFALLVACSCFALCANVQGQTFTDPEAAGQAYQLQGEYEGEADGKKTGVQVIALGEGRFRLVGYLGGLPGAGWKRGDDRKQAEGELDGDAVAFEGDTWSAALADGTIKVTSEDGDSLGELKRVERKSPTLGAKPPEGATVLFDGKSAEQFEGGKVSPDGHLMAGCTTKEKLGDGTLHIEFRTPFMPEARGQGRGNSGVYLNGQYECQVLDSFGLEGEDNECGGIYSIAKPDVNMCLPPLAWQTYDIEFTPAKTNDAGEKTAEPRVTIRHNGVVIHDDLELPKITPGGVEAGYLHLQDHGNPVVYRNIWVAEK